MVSAIAPIGACYAAATQNEPAAQRVAKVQELIAMSADLVSKSLTAGGVDESDKDALDSVSPGMAATVANVASAMKAGGVTVTRVKDHRDLRALRNDNRV